MEDGIIAATRSTGLEAATTTPVLFFTIGDGRNRMSEQVVNAMVTITKCDQPLLETFGACANVFPTEESLRAYLAECPLEPIQAVMIFDDPLGKGRRHSPLWRGTRHPKRSHARWIFGSWGMAVNPETAERYVPHIASQILADFLTNFMERMGKGQFPWGSRPDPKNHAARRRERIHEEHRKRVPNRQRSRETNFAAL